MRPLLFLRSFEYTSAFRLVEKVRRIIRLIACNWVIWVIGLMAFIPQCYMTLDIETDVLVDAVNLDLSSPWKLPYFVKLADSTLYIENMDLEIDEYLAPTLWPKHSEERESITSIKFAPSEFSESNAEVSLSNLEVQAEGRITLSSVEDIPSIELCGDYHGSFQFKGKALVSFPEYESDFKINPKRWEKVKFTNLPNEACGRLVLNLTEEKRDFGTMRVSNLSFEREANLSRLAGIGSESSIIAGEIKGPRLKREFTLAPGDEVDIGELENASVRSLNYDDNALAFSVLMTGQTNKVRVLGENGEVVVLNPSVLGFLMSFPFWTFVLGLIAFAGFERQ